MSESWHPRKTEKDVAVARAGVAKYDRGWKYGAGTREHDHSKPGKGGEVLNPEQLFTRSRGADIVIWTDGTTTYAAGPDSLIDSDADAGKVLQSALDSLPARGSEGVTGDISIRAGRYPIGTEVVLPYKLRNTVIGYPPHRGKGFYNSGGAIFVSDGLTTSDSLIRSQTASEAGVSQLTANGVTFTGIGFEGQGETGRLVDLPDVGSVQFRGCHFRNNGDYELVRVYASSGLDISSWGLPGKVEFIDSCEFGYAATSYILLQDTTQCLIMGCLFNPVQESHVILQATSALNTSGLGTAVNKTRIIGNEFGSPNQVGAAAGTNATVKLIGYDTDRHVQDTVIVGNTMSGESNADAIREDNAYVRRTTAAPNHLIGTFNADYVRQGTEVVRLENHSSPLMEFTDASGQAGKIQKADDAALNISTDAAKPIQFWPNGTKTLSISQAGYVSLAGFDLADLDKVTGQTIKSTPPANPTAGDWYIDDGTNTASGNLAIRIYDGTAWVDMN